MKILIAINNTTSREILHNILADKGSVEFIENGNDPTDEFISAWEQGLPYNLICVGNDLSNTPGMDAVIKIRDIEIKKKIPKNKTVKIFFITSEMDKKIIKESIEAGCDNILIEPLTKDHASSIIEKCYV